jgi:FtsP/CotA-like multicopper oxidase with cupredoxin domain
MAMNDFTRAQYSGQHGFLMVEPRDNPARYDQEFFLALHDWNGYVLANEDGAMNPSYALATINGKAMGSGEPLRVKQGQRILLHVLNSSPTEVHWIALAGHSLRVVALDGNPAPTPRTMMMLRLAPAERVSAIVEMNNPGVWVLGEVRKHVQALGMAVTVEYENSGGPSRWEQPSDLLWNYQQFAAAQPADPSSEPAIVVPLVFESKFRGHGALEGWTINGDCYPNAKVAPLIKGPRYRLQFINKSMDDHPLHLHRHSFELRTLGAPLASARGTTMQDHERRCASRRAHARGGRVHGRQSRRKPISLSSAESYGLGLHDAVRVCLTVRPLLGLPPSSRLHSYRSSRMPRPITRSRSTGPRRSLRRP